MSAMIAFEVVGRDGKTQLQVGENSNLNNLALKGLNVEDMFKNRVILVDCLIDRWASAENQYLVWKLIWCG